LGEPKVFPLLQIVFIAHTDSWRFLLQNNHNQYYFAAKMHRYPSKQEKLFAGAGK
jgi:hypothetical protein